MFYKTSKWHVQEKSLRDNKQHKTSRCAHSVDDHVMYIYVDDIFLNYFLMFSSQWVIHIGKGNPAFTSQMKDKNENIYELTTVTSEKDLGITFQHDMKFDIHINNIVNKANRLLGLVERTFSYMDRDTFLIHKAYN